MAISNAWKDKENEAALPEATVIQNLYNKIEKLETQLLKMRITLADADDVYNRIMDANGNNDREHYAKTMMFYGRKFCGKDVLLGIKNSSSQDKYNYDFTPDTDFTDATTYIQDFDGVDFLISNVDKMDASHSTANLNLWSGFYQFKLTWDVTSAVTAGIFAEEPTEKVCVQDGHAVGTEVLMPTILNMDNQGVGTGTNSFKVLPGYKILGWKIDQTKTGTDKGPVYELNDTLNGYRKSRELDQTVTPPVERLKEVKDTRIFAFPTKDNPNRMSGFRLPFRTAGSTVTECKLNPVFPKEIYFVLEWTTFWFNITFFAPHSKATSASNPDGIPVGAPAKTPIRTKLGQTVVLPLTSMIEIADGYKIDTSVDARGQWTTLDENGNQRSYTDDDGNTITVPDFSFVAGDSYLVNGDGTGNNIPASCRILTLKVVPV